MSGLDAFDEYLDCVKGAVFTNTVHQNVRYLSGNSGWI